ncbi:MAG: hypothetical protein J5I98_25455 [Phaeodactylibacter sp.]|nr:hypothetical protein [Phaeodactylibacter sp.]
MASSNSQTINDDPVRKDLIHRLREKVRSFFHASSEGTQQGASTAAVVEPGEIDQYDKLSELHESLESFHPQLSSELRQFIAKSIRFFWYFGRKDGSIGQKQMPRNFFKTHAEQIRDEVAGHLESQKVKNTVEYKIKKKVFKAKKKIKDEAERYRNEIFTRKELYPRNYSLWLAYFYIIIALLLIIADVPLALKLTQYGFNLYTDNGDHSIDHFFTLQQGCLSMDESFFKHIWLVFANNWEVFILAFGIALCTVYFKIFYDDFVGYPVDKAARQFKILNRFEDFSTEDMNAIRWKYYARLAVKVSILVLTLGTIIYLGFFRAENSSAMDSSTTVISESQLKFLQQLGGPVPESTIKEEDTASLDRLSKICFILITILFPVVGGICLSLGIGNFQNRRELEESTSYYESRNKEYLEALGEYTEVAKNKEICEKNLERVTKDGFTEEYTDFFYFCYQHGYERGVVEPDKKLDIYERAQKLRDRLVSTKSYDAVKRSINNEL